MKQISLIGLKLRNFKGIKEFSLDTHGEDVSIFGDNAVGKTTLFDAFVWNLFDKDSQNKKDFDIKTLDKNGKVLHNLEHEVEAILQIDSRRRTLRKVYTENWTRKRGAAKDEFTGHTTSYYIDGVPAKKGEFDRYVDDMVNENIFKLLTSPTFFNEQLDKKERRKILLEVCGDMSDAEVIANNKDLAKLPAILGDRSIDDHRKVIAAKRTDINDELKKIPIRIDEANRSKPDITELDEEFITEDIATLKARVQEKESELVRIQSGGEVAVKEKRMREIEGELQQLKNDLQAGTHDKVSVQRGHVSGIRRQADELDYEIKSKERKVLENQQSISDWSNKRDRCRADWTEANDKTFTHDHKEDCAACGQRLPEDKITDALAKAEANFNREKSEKLEQISARGKAAAAEITKLEQENAEYASQIESLITKSTAKREELQAAEGELNKLQASVQDVTADPAYISKQKEAETVKLEILELRSSMLTVVEQFRTDISKVRFDLSSLEQNKAKFVQAKSIDERIAQLEEQEKHLAAEYEQLEQELFLTEEFIRTKVSLLESKINSKFKHANFKLFKEQVNGALEEICDSTFEGVPYSSGLNNAARINIGLDIINTLSEHYGFTAPIFIDNAEAVTKIIKTIGQQIKLIVPPTFDRLPQEAQEQLCQINGSYQKALTAWENQNKQLRVENAKVKEAV